MKTCGAPGRLVILSLTAITVAITAGCSGNSSSTSSNTTTYVPGAHTGTFEDGFAANSIPGNIPLFDQGTNTGTLTYNDTTAGGSTGNGTITFPATASTPQVVVNVVVQVDPEPSDLEYLIYLPGQADPSIIGTMGQTAPYTGSSATEWTYPPQNGGTTALQYTPGGGPNIVVNQPTATAAARRH